MENWSIILRAVIVLAGCVGGLLLAGMIYYVFFEDTIVTSGGKDSRRAGRILSVISIASFMLSVYVLYLNVLPAVLVSFLAIAASKLLWNIGDGLGHAGRLFEILNTFDSNPEPVKDYLQHVTSYRKIQDLRRVARRMYSPGSRTLEAVEETIQNTVGANYPRLKKDAADADQR
jgi:hypothetical protein